MGMGNSWSDRTAVAPASTLSGRGHREARARGRTRAVRDPDAPSQSARLPRGAGDREGRARSRGRDAAGLHQRVHAPAPVRGTVAVLHVADAHRAERGVRPATEDAAVRVDDGRAVGWRRGSLESSWTLSDHRSRTRSARRTRRSFTGCSKKPSMRLPETYRTVFMLRDIEGLSTSETGEGLGLGEEAVKTRLHRARAMIRRAVTARIGEHGRRHIPVPGAALRSRRRGGAGGDCRAAVASAFRGTSGTAGLKACTTSDRAAARSPARSAGRSSDRRSSCRPSRGPFPRSARA